MEEQVTLAAYADQNRALIHNQRNNEALAICKHVLRYFPKHLETYRQMGEAYLNLEDLESAKDMFRRVLSADPEDLVSYIGLSTVFEQQRLYEEAVWHLERAYELAPESVDIQRELLRLYPEIGMRIQQRVQMTPGALARLYTREGLYPQALQELRLILAQSPTRFDAIVALAETLWNAGQLREAAEVSEKLLATLPYCLKANLILGTVWKESGLSEGDLHLQRAQEVDPTNQVAQQVLRTRSTLPVMEVTVPRYVEGALPVEQPATTQPTMPSQVGIAQETWSFTEPTAETAPTETGSFAPTPSLFDFQPAPVETKEGLSEQPSLEEAELPDWLKSEYTPSAEEKTETPPQEMSYEQAEAMLTQLLSGTTTEQPTTQVQPAEEKIEPVATPAEEEEIPEWLKGWQVAPEEPAPTTQTGEPTSAPAQAKDLPDWLSGLTPASQEATPTETIEPAAEKEPASSDWLGGLPTASEETIPTETSAPATEQAEAVPDWLSGLGTAPQEIKPTEPIAPITEKVEAVPDWLASLQPIGEEPSAPVTEEKPAPTEVQMPSTFEWTSAPQVETKAEPAVEQSFADFLANLGQETAQPSEPTPAIVEAGLPTAVEPEAQPTQEEYRLPSFLSEAEISTSIAPEPAAQPEVPLPDFLSGAPVEEKPATLIQPITPVEEWTPPEMPTAPIPVETAPPIVIETPPARIEKVAKVPKPRRTPKGSERLAQARHSRDANNIDKALTEYDYLVQRAPRLIRDVIDDLEVLVQRIDIPLDAHRILGDAYTRNDRLSDALEQYRFVMEHTPKVSE